MEKILDHPLDSLEGLCIRASQADIVTWQGRQALHLENGLALVPDEQLLDARVEVLVGVDEPAYPGIVFRLVDVLNYELAYAVPHVSEQWDALQYDPVFHGSNTWQIYHGPCYQQTAQVPTGLWFRLRVDFCGHRAAVAVEGQPPLVVEHLARSDEAGRFGLWTFRPAYFCDLSVSSCNRLTDPRGLPPLDGEGVLDTWFVEEVGVAKCEANGVLNLNRYLPAALGEAHLLRRFELVEEATVRLDFGFSDELTLAVDGEELFAGEHRFHGFTDRRSRGYADVGNESITHRLPAGRHELAALLRVHEGFGWGLAMRVRGQGLHWLPAETG